MADLFPIASFILNLLLLPLLAVLWDVRLKVTRLEVTSKQYGERILMLERRVNRHLEQRHEPRGGDYEC